ncbi:hypothetical protein ORS3428_29490 [Mesorhizobium sp. ORS 3428]|nr:hypothetical protein ORS3428_29490 [Mesorhizobium sp. ORS 3428]
MVGRCRARQSHTAAALDIVADESNRRERLARLVALAGKRAEALILPASGSQIPPIIVGDNARAMARAEALQSHPTRALPCNRRG